VPIGPDALLCVWFQGEPVSGANEIMPGAGELDHDRTVSRSVDISLPATFSRKNSPMAAGGGCMMPDEVS
jgi:hypothetical protein